MGSGSLGLVAGLLGGIGGALVVHYLVPPREPSAPAAVPEVLTRPAEGAPDPARGPVLAGRGDEALAARLERIERLLAQRAEAPGAATDPASVAVLRKALAEELDQRLGALESRAAGKDAKPPEPKKKRVTLGEAARALELTSAEEAELRRIYAESQEKFLKIVAGPDGDVEAVRRDVEDAKTDPKKRNLVMAKYMPKVLPRIGEFLQVGMEQDAAVQAALGPDKAARLDSGFDVIEANPLGGDAEMRIETSTR